VLRETGDRNQTLAFNAKVALAAIGSRRFGKRASGLLANCSLIIEGGGHGF
jgi:hypothetical protein